MHKHSLLGAVKRVCCSGFVAQRQPVNLQKQFANMFCTFGLAYSRLSTHIQPICLIKFSQFPGLIYINMPPGWSCICIAGLENLPDKPRAKIPCSQIKLSYKQP